MFFHDTNLHNAIVHTLNAYLPIEICRVIDDFTHDLFRHYVLNDKGCDEADQARCMILRIGKNARSGESECCLAPQSSIIWNIYTFLETAGITEVIQLDYFRFDDDGKHALQTERLLDFMDSSNNSKKFKWCFCHPGGRSSNAIAAELRKNFILYIGGYFVRKQCAEIARVKIGAR